MACAAEVFGDGAQLIVRNTFLELFDESPSSPLRVRPRAVSDMIDQRLPHKVQYDDVRPGSGALEAPKLPPATVPLMPVSEAYAQTPWTAPMAMPTATGIMDMLSAPVPSGPGVYPSHPAMYQPRRQANNWNYSTYQGAGNFATAISPFVAAGFAQGNLLSSTPLQASYSQPRCAPDPSSMSRPKLRARGLQNKPTKEEVADADRAASFAQTMAPKTVGDCAGQDTSGQTTIMLRNIPNRYTQLHLLKLLDENGLRSRYDFVYLPMDFRNGVNLGYTFVNLLTHNDALRAMNIFQHFSTWFYESNKVCEVSWAHPHQGLEEHVERYRNSPVMHQSMPDEYKPMLFHSGVRIPFLPPTKAIRAPKLRPVRDELKFSRQGQLN